MEIEITLRGYRCFGDHPGASFKLRPGVTAILGMNNSGKSTLLRFFYEFRGRFGNFAYQKPPVQSFVGETNASVSGHMVEQRLRYVHDGKTQGLMAHFKVPIEVGRGQWEYGREGVVFVTTPEGLEHAAIVPPDWKPHWPDVATSLTLQTAASVFGGKDMAPYQAVFDELSRSVYFPASRHALNSAASEGNFDLQFGSHFINQWSALRSKRSGRGVDDSVRIQKLIAKLLGVSSFDAVRADTGGSLTLTIDDKRYDLQEVGGGVAHMLMILTEAATRRPPYIFIDEPEAGLHPKLQTDLVELLREFATVGVVMATHSVGLARVMADYVYAVRRKDGNSWIEPFDTPIAIDERAAGSSASINAELGYHTILLVEGPTDVKVFSHWLRLYGLDRRVVLHSLGGSGSICGNREKDLREFLKFTPSVCAVVDSDRTREGPVESTAIREFERTCKDLGIRCLTSERRATENYFPTHAVQLVYGETQSELKPFELPKDRQYQWAKPKNEEMARNMTKADLDGTDIGRFLAGL